MLQRLKSLLVFLKLGYFLLNQRKRKKKESQFGFQANLDAVAFVFLVISEFNI